MSDYTSTADLCRDLDFVRDTLFAVYGEVALPPLLAVRVGATLTLLTELRAAFCLEP